MLVTHVRSLAVARNLTFDERVEGSQIVEIVRRCSTRRGPCQAFSVSTEVVLIPARKETARVGCSACSLSDSVTHEARGQPSSALPKSVGRRDCTPSAPSAATRRSNRRYNVLGSLLADQGTELTQITVCCTGYPSNSILFSYFSAKGHDRLALPHVRSLMFFSLSNQSSGM